MGSNKSAGDSQSPTQEEPPNETQFPTDGNAACRHCGREQGLIEEYDIGLCRQCFGKIARSMGFRKFGHDPTETAATDEVPEGVVRGIEDIDKSRTATKDDLEEALDF